MTLASSKERKLSIVATNFGASSSALRALDSLDRWAQERGLQVERSSGGSSDAEAMLRQLPPRLRNIVERVAKEYDLPAYELIEGRGWTATEARYCVFWMAGKLLRMNPRAIGEAFRRDPSTVRYGVREFYDRVKPDQDLTTRMSRLLKEISAALEGSETEGSGTSQARRSPANTRP